MTFFVTSTGSGKGADFGGLAGADKHCQTLAAAVGAGNHTWRAYLSASAAGGAPAVNARDRIGAGPWQNAKGVVIARNVDELHGTNNLTKQTALTEKGDVVNGRGDTPNKHDILTGSQPDGRAFTDSADHTCGNWTKSGDGEARRRPSRPQRPRHQPAGVVVELVASDQGLQRPRADQHRRRGPAVLLRREVTLRHRRPARPQRYLNSAAPALQATSSCEPVPPEQPMAPITFPFSTSGIPPRAAMTPSIVVT